MLPSKISPLTVTSEWQDITTFGFVTDILYIYRGIDAFVCQIVELIDSEPYIFVPQSTQGIKDNSLGHTIEWV